MTTNNWPDPARPGFPMFPDRDGWHVVNIYSPFLLFWNHESELWWDKSQRYYWTIPEITEDTASHSYIGPVLTPDQIKEVRREERERCAKLCEDAYEKSGHDFEYLACNGVAAQIRNLGDAP
ncbi:hypothetical protein [Acetobacter sp. DsW_059]|uniref:hypothetical protein n=1 Tax=Acetobacter sp. DsW_059 TaxID=1670661 RepID=UPI000A36D273|nr:hypothetical protein [Acetobacter sp. DsW_059]OUJ10311.1 hypothetical protein HK25_07000 [Acetobacter sp. DsW_059]